MRFLIQRVREASVNVNGCVIGRIEKGFLVLVGVNQTDTVRTAEKMVKKMIGLRIFEDENGKTNLDLHSVKGQLLIVSQFTLYADCRKGNRPSFIRAGEPQKAKALYEYVIELCQKEIPVVQQGSFGADMKISLVNDGPFTVILDSDEL
nr:D-aminoacyl-tRNA deacylase [uncultured Acetatifactor sp.]